MQDVIQLPVVKHHLEKLVRRCRKLDDNALAPCVQMWEAVVAASSERAAASSSESAGCSDGGTSSDGLDSSGGGGRKLRIRSPPERTKEGPTVSGYSGHSSLRGAWETTKLETTKKTEPQTPTSL